MSALGFHRPSSRWGRQAGWGGDRHLANQGHNARALTMTKVDCQTFWKSGNIIIKLGWSHLLSKFLLLLLSFHLFIQLLFRLKTPKSDVTPWRQLELIKRGLGYRSSHSNGDNWPVHIFRQDHVNHLKRESLQIKLFIGFLCPKQLCKCWNF